jgi:hypothetical protein
MGTCMEAARGQQQPQPLLKHANNQTTASKETTTQTFQGQAVWRFLHASMQT